MISRPPVRTSGIYSNCDRVVGGPEMLHARGICFRPTQKPVRSVHLFVYIYCEFLLEVHIKTKINKANIRYNHKYNKTNPNQFNHRLKTRSLG